MKEGSLPKLKRRERMKWISDTSNMKRIHLTVLIVTGGCQLLLMWGSLYSDSWTMLQSPVTRPPSAADPAFTLRAVSRDTGEWPVQTGLCQPHWSSPASCRAGRGCVTRVTGVREGSVVRRPLAPAEKGGAELRCDPGGDVTHSWHSVTHNTETPG